MNTAESSSTIIPEQVIEKWQELADLLADIVGVPAALIMKMEDEFMEVLSSSKLADNPYIVGNRHYRNETN